MTPSAGLQWTIRKSFLDYLEGLSDGEIELDGDVTVDGGTFTFPFDRAIRDDGGFVTRLDFRGAMRFGGHFGLLNVELQRPRVIFADGRAILHVGEAGESGPRYYPFADVSGTEDADQPGTHWLEREVTLTPESSDRFFGSYDAGDPFGRVSMDVTVGIGPDALAGA